MTGASLGHTRGVVRMSTLPASPEDVLRASATSKGGCRCCRRRWSSLSSPSGCLAPFGQYVREPSRAKQQPPSHDKHVRRADAIGVTRLRSTFPLRSAPRLGSAQPKPGPKAFDLTSRAPPCTPRLPSLSATPTMPPRRARAASTAAPPESRSRATKRAASPDADKAPAAKRVLRAAPTNAEKPAPKAAPNGKVPSKAAASKAKAPASEKSKSKPAEKSKAPTAPRVRKVPQEINPLPRKPQHFRPPLHLFTWGSGEMSQLGMDYNLEINKPRKNAFVASHIEEGTFGGDEAGLESIAAGGLHTLFVDEKGTVRNSSRVDLLHQTERAARAADLVLRDERQRCARSRHRHDPRSEGRPGSYRG